MSSTQKPKFTPEIERLIQEVAQEVDLPPSLLHSVVMQESGGNPNARGKDGEIGLMQIMPGSAAEVGVYDLSTARNQLLGGGRYLKKYTDKYGSYEKGLEAFNAGPGNVQRGTVPSITTNNYVPSVMSRMKQNPVQSVVNTAANQGVKQLANAGIGALTKPAAATAATQAAWNAPGIASSAATPASQAAWNAAATQAGGGLAPTGLSASGALSNLGSMGGWAAIPAIGVGLGVKGVSDLLSGEKTSGLGGWGGRATLGIATGGLSELARPFLQKPQTQVEEKRWKELAESGAIDPSQVPQWVQQGIDIKAKGAGARPDLAADFVGIADTAGQSVGGISDAAGSWVNNKFAKSRDVNDLQAEDIWGYAAMTETFGNDWMAVPEEVRRATANKALEMGLVSEGKGTIELQDSPELMDFFNKGKVAAAITQGQQAQPTIHNNNSTTTATARPVPSRPKPQRPRRPVTPFELPAPPTRPTSGPQRLYGQDYEPALEDVRQQNTVGDKWWTKSIY